MGAFLKWIISILGLVWCLFVIAHFFLEQSVINILVELFKQHALAFCLWRYPIYALALLFWPSYVRWEGKKHSWDEETVLYLSQQRPKLLCLFAIVELFFVANIFGKLLALL